MNRTLPTDDRGRRILPTKAQISAIDDLEALDLIGAEIEIQAEQIKVALDSSRDDMDWRHRAERALALHRVTMRWIETRIRHLDRGTTGAREPEDCDPRGVAFMEEYRSIDPKAFTTSEAIQDKITWIAVAVGALEDDVADERTLPANERDQAWLAKATTAIREGKRLRNDLQGRLGGLLKDERRKFENTRERVFIKLVRAQMPAEEYRAIWARVDEVVSP